MDVRAPAIWWSLDISTFSWYTYSLQPSSYSGQLLNSSIDRYIPRSRIQVVQWSTMKMHLALTVELEHPNILHSRPHLWRKTSRHQVSNEQTMKMHLENMRKLFWWRVLTINFSKLFNSALWSDAYKWIVGRIIRVMKGNSEVGGGYWLKCST